jgi:uncharacterized repeat protein (TIGR03837 family)
MADLDVPVGPDETLASILCYPDAPLEVLARHLADSPAALHLLVPEGAADAAAHAAALRRASRGRMRITRIPFLPQRDYDRLLWSCDLNFVRGEDSLVRAIWSGKPFVWQIYRQAGEAHLPKLDAFLRLLPERPLADATRWWNGVPGADKSAMLELLARPLPAKAGLRRLALLETVPDLASRLLAFVDVARRQRSAGGNGSGAERVAERGAGGESGKL